MMDEAFAEGFVLGVRKRAPCRANGVIPPILEEIQEMPGEKGVVLLATVKCLAHDDAVARYQ